VRLGVLAVARDEHADGDGLAHCRQPELPLRDVTEPTLQRRLGMRAGEAITLGADLLAHDAPANA
jgi:hypothetical protein